MTALKLVLALCLVAFVAADLRQASQPLNAFQVRDRDETGTVKYVTPVALYMEPSTFGYKGLENQKKNNYDNFLRSNIDNEQDNRNFETEDGKDHLPFRTLEGISTDVTNQLVAPIDALYLRTGEPILIPLRWNNPHSSELEVNIWIAKNKLVVPIKKPTCSGEGHQDNVISFIIPNNFNDLAATDFTGCNKVGDCVLQIYAHSVESRQYAMGTPVIVIGYRGSATPSPIAEASIEVGTDLSKLKNAVCLSSADDSADIKVAAIRKARYVSDQFNHAYQDSDFSPYAGQQPESISRNLQASAILKMVTGNRGELGKSLLKKTATLDEAKFLKNLRNKADNLIKQYEGVANLIIDTIGGEMQNGGDAVKVGGTEQTLAKCFRCLEVGAVNPKRLTTNTYIPSFKVPDALLAKAKATIKEAKYAGLISDTGIVGIYAATLKDMSTSFADLAAKGYMYQPAYIKDTLATESDVTKFKKVDASGAKDGGKYASEQAYKKRAARAAASASVGLSIGAEKAFFTDILGTGETETAALPATQAAIIPDDPDMGGTGNDDPCRDHDYAVWTACPDKRMLVAAAGAMSGSSSVAASGILVLATAVAALLANKAL